MKIEVSRCWAGGHKYFFRLTLPKGSRKDRIASRIAVKQALKGVQL